jgi:D-alanyl-D-alanine carboxypeptidase/D-alanyl-D-alanine-endopeptidase (penicillin-binding protein 4)
VRRPLAHASAAVLALALCIATFAQPLNAKVERAIADQQLGSSTVGVYVVDLQTGDELAAVAPDALFIPASNMKLLTSAAALIVLGEEFVFRTEVYRSGDDLLVVGSGDPALADPHLLEEMNLSVEDFLDVWAREIAARASDVAFDEILIDDRIFDAPAPHPDWPVDQLNRWYCAEVSGLNFHTNVLSVHLAPGAGGGPPRLETEPRAEWLTPRNLAKTTRRGRNTAWVARDLGSNEMTVYGDVRWSTAEPVRVAVRNPSLVFGQVLAERLAPAGAEPRPARRVAPDEDPPRDALLLAVETDLAETLRRCNVDSHNLYAEALFKRLASEVTGSQGDWHAGVAVMRMVLQQLLESARHVSVATNAVVADGSGMSRENRLTPRLLARWLEAVAASDAARPFIESLPVAGSEGTLRRRFRGEQPELEVRAKSGYLSGVSCLSGYILDDAGTPRVAFAVMVNNIPKPVPVRSAKRLHEKVVLEAEEWLEERRQGAGVPLP